MPVVFLPLAVYMIIIYDLYIALSMYILNEALLSLDVVSLRCTLRVVTARVSVRGFFFWFFYTPPQLASQDKVSREGTTM